MNDAQFPNETKQGDDEIISTHPAFGQIRASRVNGHSYLYGSEFQHHNYITITISSSEFRRHLSHDFCYEGDQLIEVSLSEAQWATFLSTLNVGSGIPCTLNRVAGAQVPSIAGVRNKTSSFKSELHDTLKDAEKYLAELKALIADSSLPKSKKEEIRIAIDMVGNNLTPNIDYVTRQFGKHVERTTESAKVEVEAYIVSTVHRAGLAALLDKTSNPVLSLSTPGDGEKHG